MAGQNTITATMGMNTQPAVQALQQLRQHVQNARRQATAHTRTFSAAFSSLFAQEPLGMRRGARGLENLGCGMVSLTENSDDALRAVSAFGRTVSTGLVGGAV